MLLYPANIHSEIPLDLLVSLDAVGLHGTPQMKSCIKLNTFASSSYLPNTVSSFDSDAIRYICCILSLLVYIVMKYVLVCIFLKDVIFSKRKPKVDSIVHVRVEAASLAWLRLDCFIYS